LETAIADLPEFRLRISRGFWKLDFQLMLLIAPKRRSNDKKILDPSRPHS